MKSAPKKKRSKIRFLVGRVSAARSKTMAAIRGKDTKGELTLRKHLFALGLRYRLHGMGLPGRPDIIFSKQKIAVFCDGDYWHGRKWKEKKKRIQKGVRAKYWINKIESNIARDRRNNQELKKMGWVVLRFWETDILINADLIALQVKEVVCDWQ